MRAQMESTALNRSLNRYGDVVLDALDALGSTADMARFQDGEAARVAAAQREQARGAMRMLSQSPVVGAADTETDAGTDSFAAADTAAYPPKLHASLGAEFGAASFRAEQTGGGGHTATWRLVFAADAAQFTSPQTSRCLTFRCKMAACVVAGGGGYLNGAGLGSDRYNSTGVQTDVCLALQPLSAAQLEHELGQSVRHALREASPRERAASRDGDGGAAPLLRIVEDGAGTIAPRNGTPPVAACAERFASTSAHTTRSVLRPEGTTGDPRLPLHFVRLLLTI